MANFAGCDSSIDRTFSDKQVSRLFPCTSCLNLIIGEPIGSTILAIIFLGEIPEIYEVFGGVVILAGILIAVVGNLDRSKSN